MRVAVDMDWDYNCEGNLKNRNDTVELNEGTWNKKTHIEILRTVAIILVLLNHSDLYYTFYTNTANVITFGVSLLISSVCKMNVPLFMMITGALLIPKAESVKTIFRKRLPRMLTVLICCSLLMYLLQCFVWEQNVFSISEFAKKVLTNDIQTSYWYLYEYIGILMMLPFVGALARNLSDETLDYFVGLGLVVKVGVAIVGIFTGYSLPVHFFVLEDSVFYVVLGYYLENRFSTDHKKVTYLKCIIVFLMCIFVCMALVQVDRMISGVYEQSVLSMMTPIMVALLYVLIKKCCMEHPHMRLTALFQPVGSCAFGIYLIEHIWQKVFLRMYLWLCTKTFGVIACSVYVICIFGGAFVCTMIMKRIKIVRKFI